MVEDIRAQLALVPEYDLEGIWAIGLSPLTHEIGNACGTYYRWTYRIGKPMTFLHSVKGTAGLKLRRSDPGYINYWYRVECSYGTKVERVGRHVVCRWPAESRRPI